MAFEPMNQLVPTRIALAFRLGFRAMAFMFLCHWL